MEQDDFLEVKLSKTIKNSNNIIHKKIITVFALIQEQIGIDKTKGPKGCKNYTKKIFELLKLLHDKMNSQKQDIDDDEIQNSEALIFLLTILFNNLELKTIRKYIQKSFFIIDFFFRLGFAKGSLEMKKLLIHIVEKCLISQTESELQDNNNPVINFTINKVLLVLSEKNENLQKEIIKAFCKVLRTTGFTPNSEFNFILKLKNYLIGKLRGIMILGGKGDEIERIPGTVINPVMTNEAENILKFLAAIIQFLPFSAVNDIIIELFSLLELSNTFIILNSLLCIEVSLSSKNFSVENMEKFIKFLLLNNQNIVNTEEEDDRIIVSYVKTLSQIEVKLAHLNIEIAVKYLSNVVSLLSEALLSEKESIKNAVFSAFSNVINNIFSDLNITNINLLVTKKNNPSNISLDDLTLNGNMETDIKKTVEKVSILMFDLVSDRYANDLRKSFEILYLYMSRIQKSNELSNINENLIKSISEISDCYMTKNISFKNFIAKLFNIVNPRMVLNYFPIQCTDYDITSDDYTDESKVWILSYLHKFIKTDLSLKDFFDCFSFLIDEIDKYFIVKNNEGNNMEFDFEIDENENETHPKIKELKFKRYVLIYEQIFSLLPLFSKLPQSNAVFYVNTFLDKMKETIKSFPEMKIYFYKCLYKIILQAVKINSNDIIAALKAKCKFYFESCLNCITNLKVKSEEEMKVSFELITAICKIAPKNTLYEKICEIVAKFEENFNKLKSNDKKEIQENKDMIIEEIINTKEKKTKKPTKPRDKESQEFRVEIINYLVKQIELDETLADLLLNFFNKYYFQETEFRVKKQFLNLFIILIDNIKVFENLFQLFMTFSQSKGLDQVSSKHKSKLLYFMNNKILEKMSAMNEITNDIIENYYFKNIILDIILLTKDTNRKVRNTSYDMIAEITDFMTKRGFFENWVKLNLSLLASSESFMKSASIYSLSRIFWQNRENNTMLPYLKNVFEIVIMLFKDNNKEIIKANFLFMRVYLYISDLQSTVLSSKTVLQSVFSMKEEIREEFKVKIRNMVKSLLLKMGYDSIKAVFPKEHESLLNYINKYIVKKINKQLSDEKKKQSFNEEVIQEQNNNLNNSFIDNTDLDVDEEEEFISKEFKKLDKKPREDEKKFLEKIESLQLNEDEELFKPKVQVQKDKKVEAIDKLFNTDKVKFLNFRLI